MINKVPNKFYYYLIIAYLTKKLDENDSFKIKFLEKINQQMNVNLSLTQLLYYIAQLKLLDPKFNINKKISDLKLSETWNYISENEFEFKYWKNSFLEFMNYSKKTAYGIQDKLILDEENEIYSEISKINEVDFLDTPKIKSVKITKIGERFQRSPKESAISLLLANYKCEINPEHVLFKKINTNYNFLEAHHLIPLNKQSDFDKSIDIHANIIALCPNCHREIHHGVNKNRLISYLFNQRKNRLKKCNIHLSLDRLIDYY